jgi:hypothetical protein
MASMEVNTYSDDGTHSNARCLVEIVENLQTSSIGFGKDMHSVGTWKRRFEETGFINVHEDVYKVIKLANYKVRLLTAFFSSPRALGLKTLS